MLCDWAAMTGGQLIPDSDTAAATAPPSSHLLVHKSIQKHHPSISEPQRKEIEEYNAARKDISSLTRKQTSICPEVCNEGPRFSSLPVSTFWFPQCYSDLIADVHLPGSKVY